MKIQRQIIFLAVLILLVGCANPTAPSVQVIKSPPTKTDHPYTQPTLTPMPTGTNTPLATTLSPTQTPTPTQPPAPNLYISTPISIPNAVINLKYECVATISTAPQNIPFQGSLILSRQMHHISSFNLETMTEVSFNNQKEIDIEGISPNRKLMYIDLYNGTTSTNQSQSAIASVNGLVKTLPYMDDWKIVRWLDNERLVVTHDSQPYNSVIVFNASNNSVNLFL